MDDNRIVVARFMLGEKNCVTTPIYQYNYGNVLRIEGLTLPSTFEVHFSNDQFGEATTAIGTDNEVTIPDTYLTDPGDVYVWIYLHDTADDGETVYQIMIPLIARAEISNEPPTPEQQDAISQAIAALNEAVSDCEAAVEHYPEIGDNGNWYVYDAETDEMVDSGIHAQGEQGETGATPNLTVGSTQTGEPGSQAQVTITGTTDDPVLDFVIPRGNKGESSHIWFSYEAPTMDGILAIFQISDLQSNTTDSPKDFELIFYGSWYYVITSVTSTVARCLVYRNLKGDTGAPGQDGANGKSASIWYTDTAPAQVFEDYIFAIAKLHGQSETPQVNELVFYNSDYYVISSITSNSVYSRTKISIKGATGADGQDGYSPTATVSKSGDTATISITDKNGTTTATVSDGDPTVLIDDTSTASNKVWSADKLNGLLIADISNVTFGGAS